MRYRTRMVLLVTVLLASAVIVISGLLAWNTRNALLESAEESGQIGVRGKAGRYSHNMY